MCALVLANVETKDIQTNKLYRFHHPDSPHAAAAAVTSIMAWNVSSKKHPNQTTTKRRICRFGKQCCCRPQENVHTIEIIQQRAMLITVLSHAFYADTGTQLSLSLHPKIPNNKMQQTKILSQRKGKRKILLCNRVRATTASGIVNILSKSFLWNYHCVLCDCTQSGSPKCSTLYRLNGVCGVCATANGVSHISIASVSTTTNFT